MRSEKEIRQALEDTLHPEGIEFITLDSDYRKKLVKSVLDWVLNDKSEEKVCNDPYCKQYGTVHHEKKVKP